MLKEQKGITLVALIITIIVMLILAGVSLSLVLGEGGAINEARNVQWEQEKGKLRDAINLANTNLATDYYTDTSPDKDLYVDKYVANLADKKVDLSELIKAIESNFESDYSIKFKTYDTTTTPPSVGAQDNNVVAGEYYLFIGKTDTTGSTPVYGEDVKDADDNYVFVKLAVEFDMDTTSVTGPIQFKVVQ